MNDYGDMPVGVEKYMKNQGVTSRTKLDSFDIIPHS